MRRGDRVDDLSLEPVGVLVLVDEHRAEAPADALARAGYLDQEALPVQQQIVEVHRVHLRLPLREPARDSQDLLLQRDELRCLHGDHLGQRALGVHRRRVQIDHRVGARETPLSDPIPEVRGGARHHFLGVLAIEKTESIRVSEA